MDEWLPVLRRRKAEIFGVLRAGSTALREQSSDKGHELEKILKGQAIALYCNSLDQTLWLVADEEDARLLGERRGVVYTAEEIQLVASIDDREFVRDVHAFKNEFNVAVKSDFGRPGSGGSRIV